MQIGDQSLKLGLIHKYHRFTGWWYTYPSEKYDVVNRDDEIPKIWKIIQMFQTTNQMYTYKLNHKTHYCR